LNHELLSDREKEYSLGQIVQEVDGQSINQLLHYTRRENKRRLLTLITRWKDEPAYPKPLEPLASSRKFSAVFGTVYAHAVTSMELR